MDSVAHLGFYGGAPNTGTHYVMLRLVFERRSPPDESSSQTKRWSTSRPFSSVKRSTSLLTRSSARSFAPRFLARLSHPLLRNRQFLSFKKHLNLNQSTSHDVEHLFCQPAFVILPPGLTITLYGTFLRTRCFLCLPWPCLQPRLPLHTLSTAPNPPSRATSSPCLKPSRVRALKNAVVRIPKEVR
jgi:hypothetical protein